MTMITVIFVLTRKATNLKTLSLLLNAREISLSKLTMILWQLTHLITKKFLRHFTIKTQATRLMKFIAKFLNLIILLRNILLIKMPNKLSIRSCIPYKTRGLLTMILQKRTYPSLSSLKLTQPKNSSRIRYSLRTELKRLLSLRKTLPVKLIEIPK